MRMRLRSREALLLKKIDEALERIEEGAFGDCESCGDEIELKRLDARPDSHFLCRLQRRTGTIGTASYRRPQASERRTTPKTGLRSWFNGSVFVPAHG